MKEISRESLHSSIRSKPKEIQDKFLDVANTLIRKGTNTSYAIQEANKAIVQYEIDLEEKALAKQEEIKKQNRVKLEKALEGAVKLPPPVIKQEDNQVDPEEIESIYFDDEGVILNIMGVSYVISRIILMLHGNDNLDNKYISFIDGDNTNLKISNLRIGNTLKSGEPPTDNYKKLKEILDNTSHLPEARFYIYLHIDDFGVIPVLVTL